MNNNNPSSQEDLQEIILKILRSTIGETKIKTGTNKKKESNDIKKLREIKREAKKAYEISLKNNNGNEEIGSLMDKYFLSQRNLREEIEKYTKTNIKNKLIKLANEGYTKSNMFWKMRAEKEGKGEIDPYDTITEEGTTLQDPIEAKEYIANYYEDLYQARPGKPEYLEWTQKIENKGKEIEAEMENLPPVNPITDKELNIAIKRLKRKKATGPDKSRMKYL